MPSNTRPTLNQNGRHKLSQKLKPTRLFNLKKLFPSALILTALMIPIITKQWFVLTDIRIDYHITDSNIITETVPNLSPTTLRNCIQSRVYGVSYFTPIKELQNSLSQCYAPLNARIEKLPPNRISLTIPPPTVLALVTNPITNHYGLLVKQQEEIILHIIGKPIPDSLLKTASQESNLNLVELRTYPAPKCCEALVKQVAETVSEYADLTPYRLIIINKPQHLGYAKLILPNGREVFFNITDNPTEQLKRFIATYKGLHQKGINFSYIDLRFDRIIIK